jgi:ribosomal protein S4E
LETGNIDQVIKFENGAQVYVQGGNNIGRVGVLQHVERHQGSYDIVHIKDEAGNHFATRLGNIFVIGSSGKKSVITLPKNKGIKQSLIEERSARLRYRKTEDEEEDDE